MLLNALRTNLNLTLPILMTRLLGITSNVIAMILIARLGATALSASAIIMGIFSFCVLLVMAFSFSLCALIAEACGRNNENGVGATFGASLALNTVLALPFMFIFYNIGYLLTYLHQPPQVVALVSQYFNGMLFGYLPMIWASIFEQFFIGIGKPRYIMYLSVLGLVVMPLFSDLLIFGKYGFPALGMLGAGLAISITSVFSLVFLLLIVTLKKWHIRYNLLSLLNGVNFSNVIKLFRLGWPVALQYAGEFLAYIFITIMLGWLGVVALAAQQIILQFTSVIVMIPTSVSQATAVLVGQAYGKNDLTQIKYQVNVSLVVVSCIMLSIACVYLLIPETHLFLL